MQKAIRAERGMVAPRVAVTGSFLRETRLHSECMKIHSIALPGATAEERIRDIQKEAKNSQRPKHRGEIGRFICNQQGIGLSWYLCN